ncbi:MAG TPA: hypothetical protein DFR83_11790 [Deltaproteobacteria bacterium]|nr:hypothetical protein [Deltaproteobacteria bacterium]
MPCGTSWTDGVGRLLGLALGCTMAPVGEAWATPPAKMPLEAPAERSADGRACMKPQHAAIQAAMADDAELAAWVASSGDYILRPALQDAGLQAHSVWFVIPSAIPHPMSVYVACDASGAVRLTSGNPRAVWRIIANEPTPPSGSALGVLVHELLRDHGRHQAVVPETVAVESTASTWTLRFQIDDRQRGREAWSVVLDDERSAWNRTASITE